MRRTNLVLDGELLERATRALGVKTYSAAVNLALAETLRLKKIESLPQFFGKSLWQAVFQKCRKTGRVTPRNGSASVRDPGRHIRLDRSSEREAEGHTGRGRSGTLC